MRAETQGRYAQMLYHPRNHIRMVSFVGDDLIIQLADARRVFVPLAWFPWLQTAAPEAQQHMENSGYDVYWPLLDEGIDLETILMGKPT